MCSSLGLVFGVVVERRCVIGLTTYAQDENGRFALPREYVDSVRRTGALPLLIPPGGDAIARTLAEIDGLVLSGGGDLGPHHYAGSDHPALYNVDAERDATELELARCALERRLPLLAICRGLQVVNVALGGALHEHLPEVVGEDVAHRAPPRDPIPHPVRVEADSRLAGIVEQRELEVASWHHQAIRELAPGFRAAAHAPDGTIEAIESDAHPRLIAVQWHPELTAATDPAQQRLFEAVVRDAHTQG